MSTGSPAPTLLDQLAAAEARIAQLQAELAGVHREETPLRPPLPVPSSILESITDAFVAFDRELRYVWVNAAAEKEIGMPREQLLGRVVWDLFPASSNTQLYQQFQKALEEQVPVEFENIYTPWNRWFWNKVYPTPEGGLSVYWRDITEQKRAEGALRESEERYRCLAEAMPQIAYLTGPDGKTEFINNRWCSYAGVPAEDCFELNWLPWVHPDDVAPMFDVWWDNLASGEPFEVEYRLKNAKGEYRWHISRTVPIRDATGAIQRWVGTATDIDDRKRADEEHRKSEERLRLALEAFQAIVYDWDMRAGVVHRTGNIEGLLGIAAGEALPSAEWWLARVHPDDVTRLQDHMAAVLTTGLANFEMEYRVRHARGHWVHLCDRGTVIRDGNGAPIRQVGSSFDNTARHELEGELKFQASILAATHDAVIAVDADRAVIYCNAAAERMYGVRSPDVVGGPLSSIYERVWLNADDEQRAHAEVNEKGRWKGELIHVRPDGKRFYVSATVNALAEDAGGSVVAVIRDITEQKMAELEIRRNAAQLTRANDDLLHFAYAVSHDLNVPLRTVCNFSQLLSRDYKDRLDGRANEFLTWMVDAGSRMSTMLRDLLRFAQVAGEDLQLREQVPLEGALAVAIENLRGLVDDTGAEIVHEPLPAVTGDTLQLAQLFQNLVGNSLIYRHPDRAPRVRIFAERRENEWLISVEDNGIGFEAASAEKIFGVFERLHRQEYAGTGVGLAICKRIVERRGGRIRSTAKPGEGARFWFSIPDREAGPNLKAAQRTPGQSVYRSHKSLPGQMAVADRHLDELFQIVDLAPAILRKLNGTIAVWPQSAERLFGWTKAEAVGKDAGTLLKTEFPKPYSEILTELLRDGKWHGQMKNHAREGAVVWCASHWSLYRDGSGRPQSIIEIYDDIPGLNTA